MMRSWFRRSTDSSANAQRLAAYDALMARARRALAEEATLAPSAWVRVRDAAEKVPIRPRWWLGAAWTAVAAVALILVVPGSPEVTPAETRSLEAERESSVAETAASPALLEEGALLSSTAKPMALSFGDGHRLHLSVDSAVRVEVSTPSETRVRLIAGGLTADVQPVPPGGRFEVVTNDAVVRVVGTRFSVSVLDAAGTEVRVEEGVVEVDAAGVTRLLMADELIRVGVPAPHGSTVTPDFAGDLATLGPGDARPAKVASKQVSGDRDGRKMEIIDIRVPDAAMMVGEKHTVTRREVLRETLRVIAADGCGRGRSALLDVIERHGPRADTWYLLGYCAQQMGDWEMAQAYFERYRRSSSEGRLVIPDTRSEKVRLPALNEL